jgi:hypothetical protein
MYFEIGISMSVHLHHGMLLLCTFRIYQCNPLRIHIFTV